MATKKKTTVKKLEITAKSVGRNVIAIIDGEKYSKAFKEKKDRLEILGLVEAYNVRNSKARLKKIIDLLSANKIAKTVTERKEKVTEKAKNIKKAVKPKVTKKPTKKELEAAAKLLEENNYGKYAKQEKTTSKPRSRRGEY